MSDVKLNLGSGPNPIEGYINIDIKENLSAYPLAYDDISLAEIRASHLLEHFQMADISTVLSNWVACLKPGGILKIAVPDFEKIARAYLAGDRDNTCAYIMGGQSDEYDFHKCIFDTNTLTTLLQDAGLEDIQPWNDQRDTCRLPISLNLQGTKPDPDAQEEPAPVVSEPDPEPQPKSVQRTLSVVMSAPRLGFTHNFKAAIKAFNMRGIEYTIGTGCYWSQVLTNLIESETPKKTDYLLTVDYDTWFTWDHVQALMLLMEQYPEADAIVPVQVKRETDSPLWIVKNEDGTNKTRISYDEYMNADLMPITLGHFGLTLFRTSVFETLDKPWFKAIPGPDNRWDEGRTDADIYFWNNLAATGCKAFLATHVNVGHMQQLCTFPGAFAQNFEPVHCYINEVEQGKVPDHCDLTVEAIS